MSTQPRYVLRDMPVGFIRQFSWGDMTDLRIGPAIPTMERKNETRCGRGRLLLSALGIGNVV